MAWPDWTQTWDLFALYGAFLIHWGDGDDDFVHTSQQAQVHCLFLLATDGAIEYWSKSASSYLRCMLYTVLFG